MIAWLLSVALAQDPSVAAPLDEVDGVEEVLVVGEHVVAEARAQVVRRLEALGWKAKRERDGYVILRPPEAWMGRARLTPYGDIDLATPVVAVSGPRQAGGDFDADMVTNNDQQAGTVGMSASLASRQELIGVHEALRAAIEPDLVAWREAIRRRALGKQLEGLPDRLDALWNDGVGLDRSTLPTWEARRAALLDYWSSRTDTVEGRAVTRAVELFLQAVVAGSEHPFTAEEIAAAQERRQDGRVLDLPAERGTIRVEQSEAPDEP